MVLTADTGSYGVNVADFAFLAKYWLADNNVTDIADLAIQLQNWLLGL
ncbi:MAG: hypothetical protein JW745_09820 [Sedimentisphaerales bacterium]|nr:hypothetical protein [Sedimentisphaerales bacterium]MBN2842706.1 hypothetical protein [Sedimentisphaerales bacterium]